MEEINESVHSTVYKRRWWILVVLTMSLLIIGLDNTILNVAIPTSCSENFSASATSLQWMVDAYILVFAGLLLTMGSLGDRFGRKRALQVGLVIFGLSSLFAAYADSSAQLITARALMGIGGASDSCRLRCRYLPMCSRRRSAARPSASGPEWPVSASVSVR